MSFIETLKTYWQVLSEWFLVHWVLLATLSAVSFIASIIGCAVLITSLPPDYFKTKKRLRRIKNPVLRWKQGVKRSGGRDFLGEGQQHFVGTPGADERQPDGQPIQFRQGQVYLGASRNSGDGGQGAVPGPKRGPG